VDSDATSGNRTPSTVAEYFGRLAATYGDGVYYGNRRRAVLDAIAAEIARARDVLDVGCGNGAYLAKFAAVPGNRRVTGADLSIDMLMSAHDRVGVKCRLLCADASQPPFKPDSFDLIFASHVFQFVADLDRVVAELARCIRPGGVIVATGQHDEGFRQMLSAIVGPDRWREYRGVIFQLATHPRFDSGLDDRFQRAFAGAGLRVEERAAPFTVHWADIEQLIRIRWMPVIPGAEREQAAAILAEVGQAANAAESRSFKRSEPLILGWRDA